ncbi:peptidoglycan-binding domain-containing protein [Corallococcus sp. 4LFB]|uniref:peptidoglycan-binding domain-containing protein n=1 Tax=Corallococcus sp. 4LFB TaxID=3383249 RepID=UPI003976F939
MSSGGGLVAGLLAAVLAAGCGAGEDLGDMPVDGPTDTPVSEVEQAVSGLSWPVLRQGNSGRDLVTAQYLLRHNGRTLSVNGSFDSATYSAALAFQQSKGLLADGIIGPATWEALIVPVSQNNSNNAVRAVQDQLRNRYSYTAVTVDGVFGASTNTAVRDFQTKKCLSPVDGIVGLNTWNALVAQTTRCGTSSSATAQSLLNSHNASTITLWDQTFGRFDGADPLNNIKDAAAGRASKTSCYGNAPCTTVFLTSNLLNGMNSLITSRNYRYFVTAISGADHSVGSLHFQGRAFDVDEVNGVRISGDSATARGFMDACRALGAIEVLGPNNDPGHFDHIHCGW